MTHKEERQKLVVIGGPTACGKSSLAVELALIFSGEIVNADSMQVYRGMDVGTAKPTVSERRGVTHHLFDVADPDDDFNAAIYRSLAVPVLKDIASRKKLCFVVGGTGLYIKTLLGGLVSIPPSDPKLREALRRACEKHGSGFLHERLKKRDPESADRIHPHDKARIIRALEIIHLTKERFSSLIRVHDFKDQSFDALKICLQMAREELYHRINERCLRMVENGLVEETEGLLRQGYSPDLRPMKALGYRHIVNFLEGGWDLDKATCQLQTDTRRYAKRQMTWFRGDPEFFWYQAGEQKKIVEKINEFICL